MNKFDIIVCDPPWSFSDPLKMSQVKRGSASNYDVLSVENLKKLRIKELASDDSLLVLWVPSALLKSGLEVMEAWNFEQKQTFVRVKTKKESLSELIKDVKA